jgi:hypothetical protein
MLLSLYMTLSYTWHNDLRYRYKSTEINAGLSDYWNGVGKLFNDDGGDDVKSKLLKGGDDDGEKKKRRPALSHARSVDSVMSPKRVQRIMSVEASSSDSTWTLSRIVWLLICMGLMLPIVEVGWGEVRRYFRLRRVWLLRSSSSVHDL